jgi:hypothetical protein
VEDYLLYKAISTVFEIKGKEEKNVTFFFYILMMRILEIFYVSY